MRVKIYFSNEQNVCKVGMKLKRTVKRAVRGTLSHEKFPYRAEVSVTFCDNERIRELNREYREKDSPTDVLSFPMYDFKNGDVPTDCSAAELGDIVLSLEKARLQAEEYGHSFTREIAFLSVHSTLHLLGYDHETSESDEREMFALQDEIMKEIGVLR